VSEDIHQIALSLQYLPPPIISFSERGEFSTGRSSVINALLACRPSPSKHLTPHPVPLKADEFVFTPPKHTHTHAHTHPLHPCSRPFDSRPLFLGDGGGCWVQRAGLQLSSSPRTSLPSPPPLQVGEFNSGKSSVINALLGGKFLAEGILPTTNEISILK
jgi:hypothetical protein